MKLSIYKIQAAVTLSIVALAQQIIFPIVALAADEASSDDDRWTINDFYNENDINFYSKCSDTQKDSSDSDSSSSTSSNNGGAPVATVENWINNYGQWAFDFGKQYGVPYEAALTIGAFESDWGRSNLAVNQHNFHGLRGGPEMEGGFGKFPDNKSGWEYFFSNFHTTNVAEYKQALSEAAHDPLKFIKIINPVYAPASDGNDPTGYISSTTSILADITKYIKDNNKWPPSSEVQYDVAPPTSSSSDSSSNSTSDGEPSNTCTCSEAAGSGGDVSVDTSGASSNKEAIFKAITTTSFTKNQGRPLNDVQAAALMGNLQQESSFSPTADNGSHWGIVQWGSDRWSGVKDPKDNLDNQIAFMIEELNGDEWGGKLSDFWNASSRDDLEKATKDIDNNYEVSGGGEIDKRINYANAIFEEYKGKAGNTDCSGDDSNLAGSIAKIAQEMGSWGGEYQSCYIYGGGHSKDKAWMDEAIKNHFTGDYGVDCSGFVGAVIYKSTGNLVVESTSSMCTDTTNYKEVSDPKPGDIAINCASHTEIVLEVKDGKATKTVGSHSTGCGQDKGPSVPTYTQTWEKYLRYIGPGSDKASK